MEFDEVVRRRRMIRSYDPDRPVPPELVDKIVNHALRAPSAGFSQGWGFLVLTEQADRDLYWSSTTEGDLGDAKSDTEWKGVWLDRMRTASTPPNPGWSRTRRKRSPIPSPRPRSSITRPSP